MLDFLLPYAYLWPMLLLLILVLYLVLFVMNLVLGVFSLGLYCLVPEEVWDSLIDSLHSWARNKFSYYFEKTEEHLHQTFQLHFEKDLPNKAIFIWNPHGLLSVTSAIHNAIRIPTKEYTPTKLVSLDLYHKIPFIRDIMRKAHVVSANYDNIKQTLETDSVSIMLGGVKELLNSDPHKMYLVIKDRKGIFKIALETGSPLVPVITYGENKLFQPMRNSFLDTLNSYLYSLFRTAIPIPTVECLKNWMMLYKGPLEPIHSYIGSPLSVKKIEHPTLQDIDALKEKYTAELRTLFEKTNPGNYELVFL